MSPASGSRRPCGRGSIWKGNIYHRTSLCRKNNKPAGWTRAIQLLGKHLNPLDDVQLLFGVDERLEEEGGGKLGRHQGDVVSRPIRLLAQGGRQELDHLPHEVEVGVVEDVVVLDEVPIVRPDPLLQIGGQSHLPSQAWTFSRTSACLRTWPGLANRPPIDPLVEQHVRRVGLLDAQVEELVRHLVVRPRVHLPSETLAGDLVRIKTFHLGVVERIPFVLWAATVPGKKK